MTDYDAIPTHVTTVARTERLDERFLRVTFRGGLERFRPIAPDQFVYVLAPPPGCDHLAVGTDFRWSQYYELADDVRPVGAYYTVRRHRPEEGELDCDVFLHEPAGAASGWAAGAAPGCPVALWGPRTAWAPPASTARWLLVADETGIPALDAICEALPADADVVAIADATCSDEVVDRLRSLALDPVGLYAWGGAESRVMRDVRRHLRHEVGLSREQVSMTPYWRHPSTPADEAEVEDD